MKQVITAKLKLLATPEQQQMLRQTQLAYRDALNFVSRYAFEHGKLSNAERLQPAHDVYTRLAYAASGADVSHVFVDGELLVNNGRLTRREQDDLLAHARSWQQRTAGAVTW